MFAEIQQHLETFVAERVAHPRDDVVSWLSRQQVDGAPLSKRHLDSITALLLIAGLGTITDTYASIFRWLADHPGTLKCRCASRAGVCAFSRSR